MAQAMRRILIIEDNALIAEHIANIVHEGGFVPIGPVLTIEEAQDAIDSGSASIDAALLDLYLDGTTETIAHRLARIGIPFAFATGNKAQIPAALSERPVCEKPFTPNDLLATLHRVFEGAGGPASAAAPAIPML